MAKLNYDQGITINGHDQTWPEKKAVEDWTWNRVKFWSFIWACVAAVGVFLLLGYWLGGAGCYTCTKNKPPVVTVVSPPASSTQTETAAVIAELAKDLSAITNVLAEQKAMAQSSASATASAAATVAPPPKTERRVPRVKQAEPACQCPPEPPVKAPTMDQNPSPAPILSSAERRRNEMWSALRR